LRDSEIREDKPLRVFILALSVFGILASANVAKAGPSMTERDLLASADPTIFVHEATQETEDQAGLDKGKRRDVQRRLTRLGFDTKVNGRFDKSTRAVITRWQAARGYPKTGFLSTLQHQALLTESVSAARASLGSSDKSDDDRPARRRGGGGAHHHHSGGGPGALIGGVVGGLFGRR
jgi:peptidoglycan hydrolase-like protein with peptidoglycan-binding domain